jgi:hypothetical protein
VLLARTAIRRALAAAPVALLLMAGCGGDDSSPSAAATPDPSDFPAADGKTFAELTKGVDESDLVVLPSEQVFEPGENRYGFGVFTVEHSNVPDAQVALYAAKPNGEAVGPFPATAASLETKPAFQSVTTTTDPDAATSVYTAQVDLADKGEWRILAMIRDDDGTLSWTYSNSSAVVGQFPDIPKEGDKAPLIHTPTADDVGGDLTKIDTRQPPDTMHDTDYADVIGKQPIVLLLATPALCMSRVCGPVVDIAEEVKSERPDDAAFIHMEIYKDNQISKGPNEQVQAFHLQSEPWLFVIGSDGKISTRIEGAFSADELNAALDKVS